MNRHAILLALRPARSIPLARTQNSLVPCLFRYTASGRVGRTPVAPESPQPFRSRRQSHDTPTAISRQSPDNPKREWTNAPVVLAPLRGGSTHDRKAHSRRAHAAAHSRFVCASKEIGQLGKQLRKPDFCIRANCAQAFSSRDAAADLARASLRRGARAGPRPKPGRAAQSAQNQ